MVEQIVIQKLGTERILVPIVGTSPLIVHNFSEKSKRQMLEAQQGKKKIKVIRDPESEYKSAFYRIAEAGDKTERFGSQFRGSRLRQPVQRGFMGKKSL